MDTINIKLNDFKNAPDGSILIKKKGKWEITNFEVLNKANDKRLKSLEKLPNDFNMLAKNNKHFDKYAKSHFLVVFNAFKMQVLVGDIVIDNESIMQLDNEVINGTISVQEAITKHEYLEKTFTALYLNDNDLITFPEV